MDFGFTKTIYYRSIVYYNRGQRTKHVTVERHTFTNNNPKRKSCINNPMDCALEFDDFYLINSSHVEVTNTVTKTITSTQGGIFSPIISFLFGSVVTTEVISTTTTKQQLPSLNMSSLHESKLQEELNLLILQDSMNNSFNSPDSSCSTKLLCDSSLYVK